MSVSAIRRQVITLVLASLAMFAFGFALVPLYEVFCQITGLNGKTSTQAYSQSHLTTVDTSRLVKVQLLTIANEQTPIAFKAESSQMQSHPGQTYEAWFVMENPTTQSVVIQAVPSVSPALAAQHFKKVQCFCFDQQTLLPGQKMRVPVVFMLSPELDQDVHTLSLAYTLFDITKSVSTAMK
ncbi:cytochrome c oxidase assembly protein [Balneatrix alpica]|uniref:Cytochrome c oxidase assembly protein CtaG n=1 Tax=Balneatrix alpica TaxID=75684 RepID=A0ABV5Z849_9GAMM|nr:cytochrome c oxidase assembly protein [Balneatrix alpica]